MHGPLILKLEGTLQESYGIITYRSLHLKQQGRKVNASNNTRESSVAYTADQQILRVYPVGCNLYEQK